MSSDNLRNHSDSTRETIYCTNCGTEVSSAWKFCRKCGSPISDYEYDTQPNTPISTDLSRSSRTEFSPASHKKGNRFFKVLLATILIGVISVFALTFLQESSEVPVTEQTTDPIPNSTFRPGATPTLPSLQVQPITNGEVLCSPTYECICPLTVSVPAGTENYIVYLKYKAAPNYTVIQRVQKQSDSQSTGLQKLYEQFPVSDISFFVCAGNTVNVNVPVGIYNLYYACGENWYGKLLKFGPGTEYFASDKALEFYVDSDNYVGHTIELWLQTNGNLERHSIPESSFPVL